MTLHMRFQFLLLNRYAESLTESCDIDMMNDSEYQNMVYNKLTRCIKHHLNIKNKLEYTLHSIQDTTMFVTSIFGLLQVVSCLHFIIKEVSPPSNFRMVLGLTLSIAIFLIFCHCGQLVTDESERFHDLLCKSTWIDWNKKNRQCLSIMLSMTAKPLKITCFGLVDLNRMMILHGAKYAYSTLTFFMNTT
ncbi:hypothetical protein JTB14_029837 [Gonioctena quinquepunctata]|nr:hypothetical protein JTB14_029837 [Gonioctena quinquepunctata]